MGGEETKGHLVVDAALGIHSDYSLLMKVMKEVTANVGHPIDTLNCRCTTRKKVG